MHPMIKRNARLMTFQYNQSPSVKMSPAFHSAELVGPLPLQISSRLSCGPRDPEKELWAVGPGWGQNLREVWGKGPRQEVGWALCWFLAWKQGVNTWVWWEGGSSEKVFNQHCKEISLIHSNPPQVFPFLFIYKNYEWYLNVFCTRTPVHVKNYRKSEASG